MYQQVYHHATVRGAGRLLRAVFERASDPARPDKYKKDTSKGIPDCLHSFLLGKRPTLIEFLSADDATILTALKQWRGSSEDPVLRYLAKCFLERRLYKEIDTGNTEWKTAYRLAKEEAKSALGRQKSADLPSIEEEDQQGLGYFVLEDNCEFKPDSLDEVLFDDGDSSPRTVEDAGEKASHELEKGRRNLVKKRLFVASDVFSSVQDALRRQVNQ